MEEIEAKLIDIDPVDLEARLERIGAVRDGEFFYRRRIFDYPDLRLNNRGAWLRLRDEGNHVTLGYKQRLGIKASDGSASDDGMEEIEVVVSDFDKTGLMLERLGFLEKFYQENRRVRWRKGDVEFDIEYWPELLPYLEIEAPTWEAVDAAIVELGYNSDDKKIYSNYQLYQAKGIDLLNYQRITFDGLEAK